MLGGKPPLHRLKLIPIPASPAPFRNFDPPYLTCSQILVITIRSIRTGLGVCQFGRSTASRGRVSRERAAPFQAQGATGRHYQGGQAPLLLPEARREEACKSCSRSQTCSQENAQGTRLTQQRAAPSRGGSAQSGPHHLEPQAGIFHTHHSSGILSTIVCNPRPSWVRGGPSPRGCKEGEQYTTCFFGEPPQFFPRGWARGNGLKGAILNGISGQGAEVYRLR